ncbi:hypothetical protein DPMN_052993 [Dreissena polymorpha]|uniref:Uncharacterized protein n=1 Tax=Dreissena polymorpha TaxID=45954 RepID=A0A9D4CLB3_DREPO|nr:hypothetical protein DPMN_052993 [Dreissena polymorpha]
MISVKKHVDNLTSMFTNHLENADSIFVEDIFGSALKQPKILVLQRQYHGNTKYTKQMLVEPSLGSRFSESNMPAFMLYQLHPNHIKHFDRSDTVRTIDKFYQIDNFEQDAMSWYSMNKKESIKHNE